MDHICKRLSDSREQNWSRTRGQRHERDEQGHGARPCVVDSFFFLIASLLRLCLFVVSLTSQSNSVAGGEEEGMKAGAAGFSELMLGRRCFGRRGKVDEGFLLRGTVSEVSFSLFFSSSDLLFFLLRARFFLLRAAPVPALFLSCYSSSSSFELYISQQGGGRMKEGCQFLLSLGPFVPPFPLSLSLSLPLSLSAAAAADVLFISFLFVFLSFSLASLCFLFYSLVVRRES
jgi:hypothetical protein